MFDSPRNAVKRVTGWTLLGDALLGGLSGAIGVGGLVLAIVTWIWKPDTAVPLFPVLLVGAVLLWLAVGLLSALRRSASMLGYTSMEVVKIAAPRAPHRACRCIFQLKPVVRLPVGSSIAFHWVDADGFERDLGVGTIQRDLENLNIEATLDITYDDPDGDKFLAKLLTNDADARTQLRVVDRIPVPMRNQLLALSKAEATSGEDRTADPSSVMSTEEGA